MGSVSPQLFFIFKRTAGHRMMASWHGYKYSTHDNRESVALRCATLAVIQSGGLPGSVGKLVNRCTVIKDPRKDDRQGWWGNCIWLHKVVHSQDACNAFWTFDQHQLVEMWHRSKRLFVRIDVATIRE